jgi:hypothetical protein
MPVLRRNRNDRSGSKAADFRRPVPERYIRSTPES